MITKFLHWLRWQRFCFGRKHQFFSQGKKVEIYSYRPVVYASRSFLFFAYAAITFDLVKYVPFNSD